MNDFGDKYAVIQQIRKFHPGERPVAFRHYGDYIGGMADSGGWHFEVMVMDTLDNLRRCLRMLEGARDQRERKQREDADKPPKSLEEWYAGAHEDAMLDALYELDTYRGRDKFPRVNFLDGERAA